MEQGIYGETHSMSTSNFEIVRAGDFLAEVPVAEIPDNGAWGPYLSLDDALKIERVRIALERGNFKEAAHEAQLYELKPLAMP